MIKRAVNQGVRNTDRNGEILAMRFRGKTYADIGKRFGFSRQRAHQIIRRELAIRTEGRPEQSESPV